jgi:hypothetical protein
MLKTSNDIRNTGERNSKISFLDTLFSLSFLNRKKKKRKPEISPEYKITELLMGLNFRLKMYIASKTAERDRKNGRKKRLSKVW